MKRAVSIAQLMQTKFKSLEFEGPFRDLIGCPELRGSWIIWGDSSNGKTTFCLQLIKYLSKFVRVAYDTLEEGVSLSIQDAAARVGMSETRGVQILDKEPLNKLRERLQKRKSPRVVVIDSVQYTGLNYKQYTEFINEFPDKLFIWISHADGTEPRGALAKSIRYDAFVKLRVEGFTATGKSRYTSKSKEYVIWKEGADQYWNRIN